MHRPQPKQVVLGRVDADAERTLVGDMLGGFEVAAQNLPAIVLWTAKRKSKKALLYDGAHERHAIAEFVHKQLETPTRTLTSIAAVENFVKKPWFHPMGATSTEPVTVSCRNRIRAPRVEGI